MHRVSQLLLLASLPLSLADETVYGAYIFHRHGDRTPKSLPPTRLTSLGYTQVYTAGQYFRERYVSSNATLKVAGLEPDVVNQAQIAVSAPLDTVLENSAYAFLQGLYPPSESKETLRNGTVVQAPMGGYQLIPVTEVSAGAGSEDNPWLQDASGCLGATTSSNSYFFSAEYAGKLKQTKEFYSSLVPVVNDTFAKDYVTFKNGYTVFDLINVATIHNTSIPSANLLTPQTLYQLRTLADAHEWGLAYNASDNMRAMPGMLLAAEILSAFNSTVISKGKSKLNIQFGAYATFLSFFGLADLPAASVDFTGLPDYASAMLFELFAPNGSSPSPQAEDLRVRFLFKNGTAGEGAPPVAFPLFGGSEMDVSYPVFVEKLSKFAVTTTEDWCSKCRNTAGVCAGASVAGTKSAKQDKKGGISAAIGGVIGAMVTLAVVLGLLALVMLVGGLTVVKKHKAPKGVQAGSGELKA
ncbi:phosphoglycerate mutase-like protein [Trichodelitschia bisporula]|uniref:Phosphoglycerate mutase-like protein n=1 Tax=Trichodelitschia bisporula TaxID=703511 RepID=A0A6G1I7P7_9PEZI|nr:phosphoglycerate mutase-like protein [Trichodelitschia bisporula]